MSSNIGEMSPLRISNVGKTPLATGVSVLRYGNVLALLVVFAAMINAYSYTLVTAIPLLQSDAWRFLDTYLGRFIEHGFSFIDLFAQDVPVDTNLPLQKLVLFFHTRFLGMDFRFEGMVGVVAGIALVGTLARATAGMSIRVWGSKEYWLLAGLTLSLLSLNSTNVYTWPLATLWFMPILMAVFYMWFVYSRLDTPRHVLVASFLLGVLLDEVAYPVYLASLGALLMAPHCRGRAHLRNVLISGVIGIVLSRCFYWLSSQLGHLHESFPARAGFGQSLSAMLNPEMWKIALIPLSDSLIHQANIEPLFGAEGQSVALGISCLLLLGHIWFWWRAMFGLRKQSSPAFNTLTLLSAAVMLLFYGLIAGILFQRVSEFGFDYLHQPRYVLFYELNLAALGMMFYRDYRYGSALQTSRYLKTGVVAAILLFAGLQYRLSTMAWEHAKYLSVYVEGVALSMGRLAADPGADFECADVMTVCKLPPRKRQELMGRLMRYRLNLFSPDFQAFHRLHPFPPAQKSSTDASKAAH